MPVFLAGKADPDQKINFRPLTASLPYSQTPVVPWRQPDLPVELAVKLECANHPLVSGNKWWKLKHNLHSAASSRLPILTFGGAYSNHIFATAAASHELGLKSIGIIRGEEVENSTLEFAKRNAMKLDFVSREEYRNKAEPGFLADLQRKYGDFFLIPEGGTNTDAIKGCREFGQMIDKLDFDVLCLPVGTGGTMAGIVSGLSANKKVVGFSSLKGGSFLEDEVKKWLSGRTCQWQIETAYHFGGYAKSNHELLQFIEDTRDKQDIVLDPVYTSKMMYGVVDLARKGFFEKGSKVLVLHTGGLQGGPCQLN